MTRDESSLPSSIADVVALGMLFEEHRPRLLAMVRRRLDPGLQARIGAEDVVNEAFLQARRRWAWFKAQAEVTAYAWLYRMALDCLIEAWRRETRARRDSHRDLPWPEQSSVQLGLGLVAPGTSPSQALVREELRQRMRQTLDMLGGRDQEILWMRHHDQLTFGEAASVLGVTESAANVRYVRALRRLKDLWHRLHPDSRLS